MEKQWVGSPTGRPSVGPGAIPIEVSDRLGRKFRGVYIKKVNGTPSAKLLDNPNISPYKTAIRELIRVSFLHYDYKKLDQAVGERGWMQKDDSASLILSAKGDLVSIHSYIVRTISFNGHEIKVVYTHYSAVDPRFRGSRLGGAARKVDIGMENPDVFCGSSGNPAMYLLNKEVAETLGYVVFPKSGETPSAIFQLGQSILFAFFGEKVSRKLNKQLVRTYETKTSRGDGRPYALHDTILRLTDRQSVFFMGVRLSLVEALGG